MRRMYLKRPFSAVSSKDPEVCETAEKEEEKEHPHKPIVDFPRRSVVVVKEPLLEVPLLVAHRGVGRSLVAGSIALSELYRTMQ